ncbi:helix-turn-helix domain-containing protein [Paraburkholderia sediminicola]|uniref:helix-turn-helix domain-containing protein n=1 Tax=Paraburkholderia sediminicola TaxID=458836 RepID=UPI0038BBA2FB
MSLTAEFELPYTPTFRDLSPVGLGDWERSLDGIVIPGDIRFSDSGGPGQVRACRLTGGGVLATVRLGHQEVNHDQGHVSALAGDDVIILVALSGSGAISQQGKTLSFHRGDITYRRARLPSHAVITETANLVILRLPIARLLGHVVSRHALFEPRRADSSSAIARMIHHFIDGVLPEFSRMSIDAVTAAEHAIVSLLCAAYYEATDNSAHAEAVPRKSCNALRWSHLCSYITANIRNSELDVSSCATALGVSRRYIHKMFESMGVHYRTFILQHRLEGCRSDLLSPVCVAHSIESIAYRNGFKDAAHFSRRFHARYGVTPREFRRGNGAPSIPLEKGPDWSSREVGLGCNGDTVKSV